MLFLGFNDYEDFVIKGDVGERGDGERGGGNLARD